MNANELADELQKMFVGEEYDRLVHEIPDLLRQQQAEIEALKMGFANSGTHDSELAETRAMAGRLFLKVQDLEFEQEGYENLTEMLESEKAELTEKNCQQQAEIEALKTRIERMIEKQSHYEAMAHTGGFEAGRELGMKQERERNNEPLAWISVLAIDLIGQKFTDVRVSLTKTDVASIPLYTHPVKELTDAITLLEKYADKLEDERPNKGLSDVVLECVEILRKAQEK